MAAILVLETEDIKLDDQYVQSILCEISTINDITFRCSTQDVGCPYHIRSQSCDIEHIEALCHGLSMILSLAEVQPY
ncbi:hypothetical protein T4B_13474 [Trichinella pseudospiralis]|uniref:Uncharacterized protein n=1 Tax=Trichinella pseudospiralis TaxID=6337 RepID=A0A0V1JJ43_TRIPS|nr:hypothetical protein T4A_4608 [Trichinella pseudospiralis]KRZ34974.1 hypothetical protein T4B_13474 [Trichinella pseudospiralis]KRZ44217.1 hypothetical protein T4C_8977 [Trichinella pseudospiralis]